MVRLVWTARGSAPVRAFPRQHPQDGAVARQGGEVGFAPHLPMLPPLVWSAGGGVGGAGQGGDGGPSSDTKGGLERARFAGGLGLGFGGVAGSEWWW